MKKAVSQVQNETIPGLVRAALDEVLQGNIPVPSEKKPVSEKDAYKEKQFFQQESRKLISKTVEWYQ